MTPEEYVKHVRREIEKAPPLPADAIDLLRRLGCPMAHVTSASARSSRQVNRLALPKVEWPIEVTA